MYLDAINVKDHGVVGDGVTDDTAAIQNLVRQSPMILYFPPGTYYITAPIVLPRTDSGAKGASWLVGAGPQRAVLWADDTFDGDAMVVWEAASTGRTRAWNQRISGLGFRMPLVDGVGAIYYTHTLEGSDEDPTPEKWQGVIEDCEFLGLNQYHPWCIYLKSNVHSSRFDDLSNDPGQGTLNYVTYLMKTDKGDASLIDGHGIHYSSCRNWVSTPRRGGYSAMFTGRMVTTTVNGWLSGVGSWEDPQWDLGFSASVDITGGGTEGLSETAQILLTSCFRVNFRATQLGTPGEGPDEEVPGTGVSMVTCTSCSFEGAPLTTGNPAWNTLSALKVSMAADCLDCRVDVDLAATDTYANCIEDLGTECSVRVRTVGGAIVQYYDGVEVGSGHEPVA